MSDQSEESKADMLLQAQAWAAAERAGNVAALEAILAPAFVGVGPFGFTLDRDQWLDRFRSGDFSCESLTLDEVSVRLFGDTALLIGRQRSEAAYQGRPTGGHFRTTLIFVRLDGAWRLAGLQYSAIPDQPPVAATPN